GISKGLPGERAHQFMNPLGRVMQPNVSSNTKKSSVMILVSFNTPEPTLTLIERAKYNGIHSGQIAFPGGKFDSNFDKTDLDTAIRETWEEVGYVTDPKDVIARLSDLYIPLSDIFVYPFVAVLPTIPCLKPTSYEVEQVFQIPLCQFYKNNAKENLFVSQNYEIKAPFWDADGAMVWGATAMIINELMELLELED
ncbi:MAG: CoA pyrophosphatase, partial [Salinivirgaceae bacterium]|nr:CoA pyrophosphatase [Salinivirgaceae bacterium]